MKVYFKYVAIFLVLAVLVGGILPALVSSATNIGPLLALAIVIFIPACLYYFIFKGKKESNS